MERDNEINELLHLLSLHGGEIVCTASLDTNDINQARASGRMSVTENNIGYVWIPDIRKFPETDEEVQFFEKWYPLDVEFPEKFLSPDYVKENIIDKVGKETSLISKLKNLKSDFDSYPDPKTSEGTIWLNYDELNRILTSLTAPVPDGEEEITTGQAKRIYEKGIAEGIVGGLNLTTYVMKEFDEVLKEVINEK